MQEVWIVAFYDMGQLPVAYTFDNEKAATDFYHYFENLWHPTKICIGKVPVYQEMLQVREEIEVK